MRRLLFAVVLAGLPALPALAEGVRVAAPSGYCIDREAETGLGLVLIGRCEGVTDRPPAVLTATVGGPGSGIDVAGRGQELAAYFQSEAGRRALSASGNPRHVQLLEAVGRGNAFLIRLRDSGGRAAPESWRAVLTLNGRLVTLTASGTGKAPLGRENGKSLISAFVDAMEGANRRKPRLEE
ncbi:cation transport ATPase [Cereibacter azotoformans]|uniref:cation transport ATPase n=1 Tax=Cereibacter azotoformans TaxID=43057 RepID=UPI000C6E7EFD|nr:cation transport ATPase [Cereibacter azotoformans]